MYSCPFERVAFIQWRVHQWGTRGRNEMVGREEARSRIYPVRYSSNPRVRHKGSGGGEEWRCCAQQFQYLILPSPSRDERSWGTATVEDEWRKCFNWIAMKFCTRIMLCLSVTPRLPTIRKYLLVVWFTLTQNRTELRTKNGFTVRRWWGWFVDIVLRRWLTMLFISSWIEKRVESLQMDFPGRSLCT